MPTNKLSVALTVVGTLAALTLTPISGVRRADRLPAGTYDVEVDNISFSLDIDDAGEPVLTLPDNVEVQLDYDQDGHVTDVMRLQTRGGEVKFALEIAADGTYDVVVINDAKPINAR